MIPKIMARLGNLLLCTAILFFGCEQKGEKTMMESPAEPVLRSRAECTEYTVSYYINGKRVIAKDAALMCDGTLYLSLEPFPEMVSEQFLHIDAQGIQIRHAVVALDQAIRVDETLYLPEPLLSSAYVHINQDVLKTGGPIYLDTHLPLAVSYGNDRYELTSEQRAVSDFIKEADSVLESGRRLWKGRGCVWVEDDWGKAYQYQKIEYGL